MQKEKKQWWSGSPIIQTFKKNKIFSYSEEIRKTTIPPSRIAPQPVTQQDMPAGNMWEDSGKQMGWIVLVNSSGSLSSSSAMS